MVYKYPLSIQIRNTFVMKLMMIEVMSGVLMTIRLIFQRAVEFQNILPGVLITFQT